MAFIKIMKKKTLNSNNLDEDSELVFYTFAEMFYVIFVNLL